MFIEFRGICCWTHEHKDLGTSVILPEGHLGTGNGIPVHDATIVYETADFTVNSRDESTTGEATFAIKAGTRAVLNGSGRVTFPDFATLPHVSGADDPACLCDDTRAFRDGVAHCDAGLVAARFIVTSGTVVVGKEPHDLDTEFYTVLETNADTLTLSTSESGGEETFVAKHAGARLTVKNVSPISFSEKSADRPPHSGLLCKLLAGDPELNPDHGKGENGTRGVGIACSNHGYP